MNNSERSGREQAVPRQGRCLYVGGSDMYNRLNQPAQHLPLHWARHVAQLDVVGYRKFYEGPPAPAATRMRAGLRALATDRVRVADEGNIRRIDVRRLRLPGWLDALAQDVWMVANLRGRLADFYELAIVYAPESALLARWLQRSGRVGRLIYHDIDYYPYVSAHHRRIVAWRETMLVRRSDAVISVSRPLVALRQEQGARAVLYLPNGVNFDAFNRACGAHGDRASTLLYMGTLDLRWGVDLPIRALPLIRAQHPDARLLIAGTGPAEDELRRLARSLALEQAVEFLGFVPYDQLPAALARAEIGMATSREEIFRQYASPLKLVEYMAAGLPVIGSGGGEAALMIEESGAGVHIPFSVEACAEAACRWLGDPAAWASRSRAAVEYARGRTWDRLAETLVTFLAPPNPAATGG